MKPERPIKCPICKKQGNWFAGNYGPFCSRHCQLVDLGKWLSEENRISEPLRPELLDDSADLSLGGDLDESQGANE
jgi:hypothetical protein